MFQILIGWLVAYLLTNGAATKQLPKLKLHASCSNLFHTNLDLNSYFVASFATMIWGFKWKFINKSIFA